MIPSDAIILSPPGLCDPALAIAAVRAGARGIIDLECSKEAVARSAIAKAAYFVSGKFGIRIGPHEYSFVAGLLAHFGEKIGCVLLSDDDEASVQAAARTFADAGLDIFVEATSVTEALHAQTLDITGLVLKGNEAAGRVGTETAFILVQRWVQERLNHRAATIPFWVQGGIGLHTAAACQAIGAAGVVLDSQLLLARETPLSERDRKLVSSLDGSETICIGERLEQPYRIYARPGAATVEELNEAEDQICRTDFAADEKKRRWRAVIDERRAAGSLRPMGQDTCLAKPLADQFVTVAGIIQAICERSQRQIDAARRLLPLSENAPLAVRHKTRYPILQGPMTRVSDTAAFADAVSRAGALPFLALALARTAEVQKLLEKTRRLAQGRSWGVGILGFMPAEIRQEQIEVIRACPPPFALIAGGRPDQARELEAEGIFTYLHVPSPGLLRMFLRDGSRHFIFEGRECGGHVGPRTSFVLWETMCEILLEYIAHSGGADELHVVFAGGIHDALSAAMVSVLSASLVERGVSVGVLMGSAYLFTQEAVSCGAIVPPFQTQALTCDATVLLQTSQGHAIRCTKTPYCDVFENEKRRLVKEGKTHDEVVKSLEWMNIGRLRVASKGIDRARANGGNINESLNALSAFPADDGLVAVSETEQHDRGMYMIGQVAAMRHDVIDLASLHRDVSDGVSAILGRSSPIEPVQPRPAQESCDIAIIGMACQFPKAADVTTYWENILNKTNGIIEIPPSHWDWRIYYDADPKAPDKIISKWGGFLDDIAFDPLTYGITPTSLPSIDPLHLFLLESVRSALADAGYSKRPFERERTCAILGIGGGGSPIPVAYGFRTCLPLLGTVDGLDPISKAVLKQAESRLPSWTEDSFPGILASVAAGRVANRFDLGGANYTIDAACGSSLAALQACIRELEAGSSDVALAMAADMVQTPYAYMAFSKTHALSPRGQCRPFDAGADGIALSEGLATIVLKRRADAERDGDKIYAIIRGMGSSSDGRAKGLTAPRTEGQLRALSRAYERAGVSAAQIGLVEAHGTGTIAGDQTEAEALGQVLREAGAASQSCAIGSVKSMIGHSKCAAGLAGLIKTALALQKKVLPPTLIEKPNPKCKFDDGPLYLNGEARPWIHGAADPRRAGVSAFGFGGTNFHIVLEEYRGSFQSDAASALKHWPAELLVWRRDAVATLLAAAGQCHQALKQGARPELADLALSLWEANPPDPRQPVLAIVATSLKDLEDKLVIALQALREGKQSLTDPRGIYFDSKPSESCGKVAFIFPGQGSQYPDMLGQLAIAFEEVRETFDNAERDLLDALAKPLGRYIFPPTAFTPEQEKQNVSSLMCTDIAQPAVGAAGLGMFRLLTRLGLKPDFLAGHSYGDYIALCAAEAIAECDLPRLSHQRGKLIVEASSQTPGSMAAFDAPAETVETLIAATGATIANKNAPRQTVISGTEAALDAALAKAKELGIRGRRIAVSRGFHSPLVAAAREPFARVLQACSLKEPRYPVFSNTTAATYPSEPAAVRALLADHLVAPVRFHEEVLAMYEGGARVFVEVGPQAVLTGLVGEILTGQSHVAVASDVKGRPSLVQLAHLLGQLLTCGLPVDLSRLYATRHLHALDITDLVRQTQKPKPSASSWIVNSVRNRPINGPEPVLLGQPPVAALPSQAGISAPPPLPDARTKSMDQTSVTKLKGTERLNGVRKSAVASEETQIMLRYQDLMSKFLETQKSVMMSYLQGEEPAGLNGSKRETRGSFEAIPGALAISTGAVPQAHAAVSMNAEHMNAELARAPETVKMDRDWFTNQLLDLVSKRTGYPKDMLGLDQNLEADLGIDSIKRVEILDSMAAAMEDGTDGLAENLEMEKLAGLKTLGAIIDYLERALTPSAETVAPPQIAAAKNLAAPAARTGDDHRNGANNNVAKGNGAFSNGNGHIGNGHGGHGAGGNGHHINGETVEEYRHLEVRRALVRLADAPPSSSLRLLLPRGVVLFSDDGRGVAREMADRLADFGQKTVLVSHAPLAADSGHAAFQLDLTEPAAVEAALQQIRNQHGTIAGLVHLLPLAVPPAAETPMARMNRDVKSLYLLAHGLDADLRRAGSNGGAILLTATDMGGAMAFGDEPLPPHYFAGHGGVAGFAKCLAFEWPSVLVRTVDLDTRHGKERLVDHLLAEFNIADGPNEVGYAGMRRVTWEPVSAPLQRHANPAPLLGHDATVLITGGARGITGAVAVELARRYRSNLIITGRSPKPAEAESPDTASLTAPVEIKARLIARLQTGGYHVPVSQVEAEFQRLMIEREMRSNLRAIAAAGSNVEYHQIDARDRTAMTGLLADVNQRFCGLDGVIHGAGIMEDKLVKDKTMDSFNRVFETKAASTVLLTELVQPERLKFCVFFASITSRYGNKGQSDYAAGNEILSKMALQLDRLWPCRVVAVCWGPWSRIGMTADLETHLTKRGLQFISPEEGPGMLIDELVFGRKGETEVIIAAASEKAAAKPSRQTPNLEVSPAADRGHAIETPP